VSLKSDEYSVIELVDLRLISDSDKAASCAVLKNDATPARNIKKKSTANRQEMTSIIVVRLFILCWSIKVVD